MELALIKTMDDPQHDWLNANVSRYRRMPADLQRNWLSADVCSNFMAR